MPLAKRTTKTTKDHVFSLIGMRGALYQLFVEALAIGDEPAKEAAVSFIHQRNIEKYEPFNFESPSDFHSLPKSLKDWALTGSLNGKKMLTPIFSEEQEGKEVVCFLLYEGVWLPYLLTAKYPGMQFPAKMVELFGITHTTWADPHAMNAQKLVDVELIDSAEAVLRVPSEVIDYILTNK